MKTSSRRKATQRRTRNRVVTALIVTVCLAAAMATAVGVRSRTDVPELPTLTPGGDAVQAANGHEAVLRAVYQHSVVPGGVYDPSELRAAIARDSVVAAHYAGISVSDARVERVKAPRQVYVSYRIGDQIYWTKSKVALNPGEAVITDGINEIRARCGNCISLVPMSPTLEVEPPLEELDRAVTLPGEPPLAAGDPGLPIAEAPAPAIAVVDLPIAPAPDARGGDPALGFAAPFGAPLAMALTESNRTRREDPTENVGDPAQPGDDPVPPGDDPPSDLPDPDPPYDPPDPPYYPPDPPVGPPDKPVSVPEPGSLLLMGTGLAAYALRRRSAKSAKTEPKAE